jgi:hypothetical protein
MTMKQTTTAQKAYSQFRDQCVKVGTDRNQHEGIAVFMIAKALMRVTLGLKYYQAEQWALNYLATRIEKAEKLETLRKKYKTSKKLIWIDKPTASSSSLKQ